MTDDMTGAVRALDDAGLSPDRREAIVSRFWESLTDKERVALASSQAESLGDALALLAPETVVYTQRPPYSSDPFGGGEHVLSGCPTCKTGVWDSSFECYEIVPYNVSLHGGDAQLSTDRHDEVYGTDAGRVLGVRRDENVLARCTICEKWYTVITQEEDDWAG